ncbi:hypothetical protein KFE80_08715 [bacterium SCSIO 12696]|nr:hypothetical protein KFE80_08715 [bacterium SCSIO 12696]
MKILRTVNANLFAKENKLGPISYVYQNFEGLLYSCVRTIVISFLLLTLIFLSGCSEKKLVASSDPELHVIGVYEGTDPDDDGRPWWAKCETEDKLDCHREMVQGKRERGGEITVNVSIVDSPIVLALSAYDKTKWIVNYEDGVKIQKLILSGYHEQTVSGLSEDVSIEVYTHDSSYCKNCYQGKGYFYSYKSVPKELQTLTGLKPVSFQGKYTGKEFAVFHGMPSE